MVPRSSTPLSFDRHMPKMARESFRPSRDDLVRLRVRLIIIWGILIEERDKLVIAGNDYNFF